MNRIFSTKRFQQLFKPKRLAIFEACLIGLVAGLSAVLLKQGVGWLGAWRISASQVLPAWLVLPGFGCIGGFLAGWLVECLAPAASGSGMSEVKAVLARVPIPLNLRVAVVKLLSAILVLGSGLALGREGPTVQIGASLAAQLSRWFPSSADYRRQLIAAGAGAGLAAAFNAPIAGVLFVVEELLQDMSDLTLGTAILASFIGAIVSRVLGGHSLDINLHLNLAPTSFSIQEIPFYLILGVLAGVLGALFNRGVLFSLKFNKQIVRRNLAFRVALAGLVCGLLIAVLPDTFHNYAGLQELLITGKAGWEVAAIAFVMQFLLILVAYGSGAPGGLLVPTLVLGAALGYLVGASEYSLLGMSLPMTYARVGMGAFFGAVSRVPITAIIIIFEMTTDFNLVLPLMISSIAAYLVADKVFSGSLYDHLLEWKGIHLEKEETATNQFLTQLTATEVMQRKVETLSSQMSLDEAVQAFSRSHHRGFPVVNDDKLVGIITQIDLANIAQRQLSGDTSISEIMTVQPVTVNPTETLSRVLYLLNHYNLSRLPVTSGGKLIGIITRSDIIRAESDCLNGATEMGGPKSEPSYVVYQSRVPASGKGRLLVPLANPQTTETLLKLAAAIAHERHYELECLHVVLVPRNLSLTETPVDLSISHHLLSQAVNLGQTWNIPVHTQIRLAHDVAQAILETIDVQHINLTLMGWKGSTETPGRVFGSTVDTVIRQAACNVVLVKLGEQKRVRSQTSKVNSQESVIDSQLKTQNSHTLTFDRWLVPMAGGPNAQEAVKLLPALSRVSNEPEVRLCQVFKSAQVTHDTTILEQAAQFLKRYLESPVLITPVCSSSVPDALVDLAEKDQCDVIMLGASRERLLQQVMKGNIPEEIARKCDCTVILVRGA